MNISRGRNNVANDCAGEQGEARKEIYSKISMKFLGGSAYTRRTIMHARMLIDTWVERRLGPGARRRDLSLCIPFRRPSLFYILQEEAYRAPVPTAFANFSSVAKRNGRQFGAGHMCARVYTVTLTLLLQFNAFHRQAELPAL